MTLHDFRHCMDSLGEFFQHIADNTHANESCDGQAYAGGVDFGSVGADDSFVFHAAYTLGNGGRGESYAASKLRKRDARVRLQFDQQLPAEGIEELFSVRLRRVGSPSSFYLTIIK